MWPSKAESKNQKTFVELEWIIKKFSGEIRNIIRDNVLTNHVNSSEFNFVQNHERINSEHRGVTETNIIQPWDGHSTLSWDIFFRFCLVLFDFAFLFWSFDFLLLSKQWFPLSVRFQRENSVKILFQYPFDSNTLSEISHSFSSHSQSYRIQ
jgi:hypothetical protein